MLWIWRCMWCNTVDTKRIIFIVVDTVTISIFKSSTDQSVCCSGSIFLSSTNQTKRMLWMAFWNNPPIRQSVCVLMEFWNNLLIRQCILLYRWHLYSSIHQTQHTVIYIYTYHAIVPTFLSVISWRQNYTFISGQETTTSAISWLLHNLTQHKEYQYRVQKEIDSLMTGRGSTDIVW